MYPDASQTGANVTLAAGSQDAVVVSGAGVDTAARASTRSCLYYDSRLGTTMTGGTSANT
jgi:hypothetical protein